MLNPTESELIDARGMRCPWPVLRAARAMRIAGAGHVITIVADDPIAAGELAAFAREHHLALDQVDTPLGSGLRLSPKRSEAQ